MFGYFGSKWRLATKYPTPRYPIIEPFAGSAGYSLLHYQNWVLLNDTNPNIYDMWRYLLSYPDVESLSDDIALLSGSAKILAGFWLSKAPTTPRTKRSSWVSKYPGSSWWGPKIRKRLQEQIPYIRHWEISNVDYIKLPDIEATWFIDPPYQRHGRSYPEGSMKLDYSALADWCRSRRGQVIVCEGEGANWLPFSVLCEGKRSTGKRDGRGPAELVWYNK